jgi:predicted metal-binding membrane protein
VSQAVARAPARPALLRLTPPAALLLLVAAIAWPLAVREALQMGNGPGTMGLGVAGFLGMWALMMAAMMLPSVTPMASLYVRTIGTHRGVRLVAFASGYLAVWIATGIPVYLLLRATGAAADAHEWVARATASGILVAAGAWQLSGAKQRCLTHCRSPLGLFFHYASRRGRLRDLRVSLHHAAYCVGCCWLLMALFAVFGVMNIAAMAGLAVIVLAEKLWSRGAGLSRAIGVACLLLAVAALVAPSLTPGLATPSAQSMPMPMR